MLSARDLERNALANNDYQTALCAFFQAEREGKFKESEEACDLRAAYRTNTILGIEFLLMIHPVVRPNEGETRLLLYWGPPSWKHHSHHAELLWKRNKLSFVHRTGKLPRGFCKELNVWAKKIKLKEFIEKVSEFKNTQNERWLNKTEEDEIVCDAIALRELEAKLTTKRKEFGQRYLDYLKCKSSPLIKNDG